MSDPPLIVILPEKETGYLLEYRIDASGTSVEAHVTWDELTSYRRARTVRRTAWLPIGRIQLMSDDADVARIPLHPPAEQQTASVGPPGWPTVVPAADAPEFGERAVAFLLDHVPHGYRAHAELFARYPLALAIMALRHLTCEHDALKAGYRSASYQLKGLLEPHAIDQQLEVYRAELERGPALRTRRPPGRTSPPGAHPTHPVASLSARERCTHRRSGSRSPVARFPALARGVDDTAGAAGLPRGLARGADAPGRPHSRRTAGAA